MTIRERVPKSDKLERFNMENKIVIPKTVYDKEYSTQWRREVEYLEEKGIAYTYAKRHYKYPVTRYKYAKTPELFLAEVTANKAFSS